MKEKLITLKILKKGFPLRLPYGRFLTKTPYMGTMFAQDIEPCGEYMTVTEEDYWNDIVPDKEYGYITFQNPLIIEWETTTYGGWKTKLSKRYNKIKQPLSDSIIRDGYDGIVTICTDLNSFCEMVNLNGSKEIKKTTKKIS